MATYVSPVIEQITDYTDTTRGWYCGSQADVFGSRAIVRVDVAEPWQGLR